MGFESEVKLSDFDVAKAAGLIGQNKSKQLSDTPGYMSPEQGNNEVTYQRQGIFFERSCCRCLAKICSSGQSYPNHARRLSVCRFRSELLADKVPA